ncbi:MAG: DNA topoisomerase I [Candidatus Bathyarchaeota archaeon B63]|nr:MAG: DNA topoisomerase I [Candidatus Bathyarchaeota archaeon B63]
MSCKICGRRAKSRFCDRHEEAYSSLLRTYEDWRRAMKISWTDYLKEVSENPYAGIWVKEVAAHLLNSDGH